MHSCRRSSRPEDMRNLCMVPPTPSPPTPPHPSPRVAPHWQGGHTIWQDERQLLREVEARLSRPIPALPPELSLPPQIAVRLVPGGSDRYGQQRGSGVSAEVQERVQARLGGQGCAARFRCCWAGRRGLRSCWPLLC